MKADTMDINMFVMSPVLAEPAYSLATKRVVQNGRTPESKMKYLKTSSIFDQIPNSPAETLLVIKRTKANPVATLRSLEANMTNPAYLSLISFLIMKVHACAYPFGFVGCGLV